MRECDTAYNIESASRIPHYFIHCARLYYLILLKLSWGWDSVQKPEGVAPSPGGHSHESMHRYRMLMIVVYMYIITTVDPNFH